LAIFRAAIEGRGVAVVAAFGAFLLAVTAGGLRALGRRASVALEAELQVAGGRATVAGNRVAVVAGLGARDHAVATTRGTRLAGHATLPALLDGLAILGATVAVERVAVVAGFIGGQDAVATLGEVFARLSFLGAVPVALDLTNAAAPVPAGGVAVVAALVALDDAVAAAAAARPIDAEIGVGHSGVDDNPAASAGRARAGAALATAALPA
jgi:hypothetical protein